MINDMVRVSGISERYANIRRFDDLSFGGMPPGYMACVSTIREFLSSTSGGVLAIVGRWGTGKTQICCTAVFEAIARGRYSRIERTLSLVDDLRSRFSDGSQDDWRKRWMSPWLLCLDEFGVVQDTEFVATYLTDLISRRHESMKKTIVVSNGTAEQFAIAAGPWIADRCNEGGGVIECNWGSLRC